jgi:hypothetical protein
MAIIHQFGDHLSIQDKWEICKKYYEKIYSKKEKPIRFRKMPSYDQIEDLFQNIGKLEQSIDFHLSQKPGLEKKFYEKNGLVPEEIES